MIFIQIVTDNHTAPPTVLPGHMRATPFEVEALDMDVLSDLAAAQLDDEPDIIVELIDLYLEDALRRLAAIEQAQAQRDELALRRLAHCLKGSSASLGLCQLATLCAELEQTASDSD